MAGSHRAGNRPAPTSFTFHPYRGWVKRVRVVVSGRVQGVFYRATCARLAREAGLGGWVRNRDDGRVEAAFEGEDAAVEELVAWCRLGPRGARVDSVEVIAEAPSGEASFRVTG
jgi:acylphosphatase